MGKLQLDCLPIVLYNTTKNARFAIMMNSFISAICFINKSFFLVAFVLVSVECFVNVLVFFSISTKNGFFHADTVQYGDGIMSRGCFCLFHEKWFLWKIKSKWLCARNTSNSFVINKKKRIPIPCRNVDVIFYDVWPHKGSVFLCW